MLIEVYVEPSYNQVCLLAEGTLNLPDWDENNSLEEGIAISKEGVYISVEGEEYTKVYFSNDNAIAASKYFCKEINITSPNKIFVLDSLDSAEQIKLRSNQKTINLKIYVDTLEMYENKEIIFISDTELAPVEVTNLHGILDTDKMLFFPADLYDKSKPDLFYLNNRPMLPY